MLRGLEAAGQIANRTTTDADATASQFGGVRFLRLDLVGGSAWDLETSATSKAKAGGGVTLQAVFALQVTGVHLEWIENI